MRRFFLFFLFLYVCACEGFSQVRWNSTYQEYIDLYKDLAIEQMLEHHIPASITLAQGLLESGAGKSELARRGNNHFGIKCHGWTGRSMNKDDDAKGECFRVYDSPRQSFEDHSAFLKRNRYASLFQLSQTDYKGWARGLKKCGYATLPTYADRLISIIETYDLAKYDQATKYDKFVAQHQGIGGVTEDSHQIHFNNRNYYIHARRGDTFKVIGEEMGVSWRKLAKYNERDKHDVLKKGEIVYLEKKRKKAEKRYKKHPHIVKRGESMYDVAQKYGIRLKSLYKMNDLTPDYMPKVGDKLRIY